MRHRAAQSSRPCANGSSITSRTCGMAAYTGATHGRAATAICSPRAASLANSGSLITASPIHCGAVTLRWSIPVNGPVASGGYLRQPLGVFGVAPVHNVEERTLDLLGDWPARALAEFDSIELADRRHLGGRTGEEGLVADVDLV